MPQVSMNYKIYWNKLKLDGSLHLEFDNGMATKSELELVITKYRRGLSRCKARDINYLNRNPDKVISFSVEYLEDKVSLQAFLILDHNPLVNHIPTMK